MRANSFKAMLALILLVGSWSALAEKEVGHRCNPEDDSEENCDIEHGKGKQYCRKPEDEDGKHRWTKCLVDRCNSGYVVEGNECVRSTSTGTNSNTSTATQTSALTVTQTATWTSTASHVNTVTKKSFEQEVSDLGGEAELNQRDSIRRAQKSAELGASYGASVAVVYCMEGMNVASDLPVLSGSDFAACRDHFQSASKMNEMANQTAFLPDKKVMESDGAKSTLEEFEKKFGVDADETVGRIFASKGSHTELADIMKSKIDDKKLEKIFGIADDTPKAAIAESFALEIGAKGAKSQNSSLRDKLRAQATALGPAREKETRNYGQPVSETAAKNAKLGHIEPLSTEEFFPSERHAEHEFTIFDVVKRKYREMSRRQNLVPQAVNPLRDP